MPGSFKVGDQVSWNSEAGYVSGVIIAVRTVSFDYKAMSTGRRRKRRSI